VKFHMSKWKFLFLQRMIKSSLVEIFGSLSYANDVGSFGFSLKKNKVGKVKIVITIDW